MSQNPRDRFVLEHLHLVEPIARHFRRRLPPAFELEDLVQDGMLGLLEAAESFDPHRGASERTWATTKIMWAIRDAVSGKAYEWAAHRVPLDDISDSLVADPPVDPPAALERLVEEAIGQLPRRQADVVRHVYEHGESLWSLSQSKALGIGWRVLRAEHTRALVSLRPLLDKAA